MLELFYWGLTACVKYLQFNRQPGKAIQQLISSGLVEKTPAAVAQFLQNTPNLDKVLQCYSLGIVVLWV